MQIDPPHQLNAELKRWNRERLRIDVDTAYVQGIVTLTTVGKHSRVAWKCDDATYRIGTDRTFWHGYDSFGTLEAAQRVFDQMVERMRGFGLDPEIVR